jgi:phage baseplate assembly protein W
MARQNIYRGYSSFEYEATGNFKLVDIEAVKMDLLNHIFTRRGERVMLPTFGTIIPDLTFEPLDDETIEVLDEELRAVFEYDPRVELLALSIVPNYDNNSVVAQARLRYIELDTTDLMNLNIQFDQGAF